MPKLRVFLVMVQAALVAALGWGLLSRAFPLGVPGEWEWLRLSRGPAALEVGFAALAVILYAGGTALGMRFLMSRTTPGREVMAVAGLALASIGVLAVVPMGAPAGYGLAKWSL